MAFRSTFDYVVTSVAEIVPESLTVKANFFELPSVEDVRIISLSSFNTKFVYVSFITPDMFVLLLLKIAGFLSFLFHVNRA